MDRRRDLEAPGTGWLCRCLPLLRWVAAFGLEKGSITVSGGPLAEAAPLSGFGRLMLTAVGNGCRAFQQR